MIGTSLGPYKILESLGAGGMGEVYLGEDTRLGRKVAIKVLPEEFASDPERLARFEQEARAAAALNHPHIAVVHDIGFEEGASAGAGAGAAVADHDSMAEARTDPDMDVSVIPGAGVHYMVQEYLEGQSLRDALEKGAMPLNKTLDLATEFGEALIAAHEAGIIHRDLKPDNIFVTKEGHAKVLDFGLAKLIEGAAPAGTQISMSPTVLGTVAGQVMGTAGYMAPEQIQGEVDIDQRTDLFAFGCVLYEMLAGKRAFSGETVLDTLHAIARTEPQPLGEIKADLPLELHRILKKCLAKDADRRYQAAGEVVVDLRQLQDDVAAGVAPSAADSVGEAAGPVTVGWSTGVLVASLVAIAALTAAATWFATRPAAPEPQPLVTVDIPLPADVAFTSTGRRTIAFSPVGTHLAFAANNQIWVRAMDEREAVPLRGTEGGGRAPFFSPDGQEVGFFVGDELKKVPVGGGAALPLTAAAAPFGATWLDDGTIIYGQGTEGIWRVSENGGEAQQIVAIEEGRVDGPQLLPGGEWLLYAHRVGSSAWDDAQIVVQRLGTDTREVVIPAGRDARYVPTGHIVYAHEGTLWAVPFDPVTREAGGPVQMIQNLRTTGRAGSAGAAMYSFTNLGGLAYVEGQGGSTEHSFVLYDRQGTATPLPIAPRLDLGDARLSPDGTRIAARAQDESGDDDPNIWIFDTATGRPQRLTSEGVDQTPTWSPDGATVYYTSSRGGPPNIYSRLANFSGEETVVLEGPAFLRGADVSPAGDELVYERWMSPQEAGVLRLPLEGDPSPEVVWEIAGQPTRIQQPRFSPDGRFVAYSSNESGPSDVYVIELATQVKTVVSTGGGIKPLWSPDGSEIFYSARGSFYVADVLATEPQFTVDAPRLLFQYGRNLSTPNDVTPDGQRFLSVVPSGADQDAASAESEVPHITVVLNWFEELKRRAPKER